MKTKFKVNDRVKISPVGFKQWKLGEANPADCLGTITGFSGGWIEVTWDNGFTNAYDCDSQLTHASA